mmetsp:Transcript_15653/g.35642  ORF Transcript_15653/g.35642 Transcript_15653/m.35642 type:complete len:220 (-) Transcript_15653:422-1081(-)
MSCTYKQFRSGYPAPLECAAYPNSPGTISSSSLSDNSSSFWFVTTMAPAPSPNKMHALRSSQSIHLDNASAPMTNAFFSLVLGLLRNCPAVTEPNKKPLQAAVRSKAMVFVLQPIAAAIAVASPNMSSGLEVAQITTSMSSAETPAISSACLLASVPSSRRDSPATRTRLWEIPVRVLIHSSSVSTTDSMSLFETIVFGAAWPTPMGRQGRVPDETMDN